MRNIFLDMGTHFGQGLSEFVERFGMDDSWEIHTFEANPTTYELFVENHIPKHLNVNAHNKAIHTFDGSITLNVETPPNEGDTGMGTSIITLDKWNPWGGTLRENFKKFVVVECVDISKFIIDNYDRNDNIIVKMDIEGAEYEVLERMISTEAIKFINFIAVEWHSRFFVNVDEMELKESGIIKTLNEFDIKMENWK